MTHRIAVLLPCYNEEAAIAGVVTAFRSALPNAEIYVFDNNSTDGTAAAARGAGAIVRSETMQGKGHVIRRMFADVDADIYVLADGDGTYDPAAAPAMIAKLIDGPLDMVVGARVDDEDATYRLGHRVGNRTLSSFVAWLFGDRFSDILSGYRVLSRRFVKSFPALASGFETESELTIHALELKMPVADMPARYFPRVKGTASKLNTWRDGMRILAAIVFLFKEVRPFKFFGSLFGVLAITSIGLAWPLIVRYLETGLVPRLPTAILSTGIMVIAFICLVCGIVLDTVSRGRREAKRMRYLSIPAPQVAPNEDSTT